MPQTDAYSSFLDEARASARHWLFELALPLWWERGADHAGGGFHEKLDQAGIPVGQPLRVRVQARQVYVYAKAGALGWPGPWRDALRHGLAFMQARHLRADGFYRSTPDPLDQRIDLYDQAFVLFALAHAWTADGRPAALRTGASTLLRQISERLALPEGGYLPALPAEAPLQSNPLMHLLEALLAWVEAGAGEEFAAPARALAGLAATRLVDPAIAGIGAIGENFGPDWSAPVVPQSYEPGHQLEWAYLFLQADARLGTTHAGQAFALERFARRFGSDAKRQVALFALDASGAPTDRRARLWAQTERLRTSLLFARLARSADSAAAAAGAIDAFAGLQGFLATPVKGLWFEWQAADGSFDPAPAPASTLYHLMTGLGELLSPADFEGIKKQ